MTSLRAIKPRAGRRPWGRWALRLLAAWVGGTALLVGALRFVDPPTTAFMLEHRGPARHRWVPLSAISPHLAQAVVAAEDQRFPSHHGFDAAALSDAVAARLEGRPLRGASTLSQQVAKNLFLWPGRSLLRKGLEAYFTVLLEGLWPKRRILEVYLNVAEWGDGLYGAEAAARHWFGESARALSAEQAAALAACLPNPRGRRPDALSPAVQARAGWIAAQARALGPHHLDGL